MEDINLSGYGENVITMRISESITGKNDIVKIVDNYKVGPCASGDPFFGVLVNLRGEFAAIQTKGYFKLKKSGTINVGYQELAANSSSTIKALEGGVPCHVVAVDDTYVEFIM